MESIVHHHSAPHIAALLLTGAAFLLTVACSTEASGGELKPVSDGARPRVVATTVQIEALAREVGGSYIELRGLVPAGADAHEFEPRASDLAAIEDADLILRHGLGLDDWLDDTLRAAKNAGVVAVTDGISSLSDNEDGESAEDPHVWHDPENDKLMVHSIAGALGRVDPANRSTYEANATAYSRKVDATSSQVQAIIDEIPPGRRKMVTDHDAFGYFARAFGLTVIGTVIPSISTGAEPSAKQTAALLDQIRKEDVKAIFAEESVNPALARTLARDAGVQIIDDLYGDSLGKPGSGAETIDGMLLANARKIADALK